MTGYVPAKIETILALWDSKSVLNPRGATFCTNWRQHIRS